MAKYHGLKNQGATCYLNSVLQVLFMTKEFREDVQRYDGGDTECIEHHLKHLFEDLNKYTASTLNITKKLDINNVHEHCDAAEYLEKILRLTNSKSKASKIFHGELTHENKCLKCHTVTNTGGPFWYLPLALDVCSENYSVVDGIEKFFSTSEVSGVNQMYCDNCDDKANAALTSVMTCHPDVLMLLLKRFEFDYRYMAYVKINCFVNVPFILQIPKNETFRYELYAVVDHFGDLTHGHYTTSIQSDEDNRWYKFDDCSVSEPFQVDSTKKQSQSAYLLFYRKKKMEAADTCTQVTVGKSTPEVPQVDISDSYEHRPDAEKKHEDGEGAEAGNVTVEVSTDVPEETETRDRDRDRDRPVKKMRGEEDMGGKTRADEHTERRELLSIEGINDVTHIAGGFKQDVSDVSAQHDDFNKQDVNGKTRDKQSETKRKSPTKSLDNDDRAYEDSVQIKMGNQEVKQKEQRVEDQNKIGVHDRRNTPEQESTKSSDTTHKDVGAKKKYKEQEKKSHTQHIPKRQYSPRQAGLAGRGRLTESQRVGSDEKDKDEKDEHMNCQPSSKICDEEIIEGENRRDCGMKSSSVIRPETQKASNKRQRPFDAISKGLANLRLSRKHSSKRRRVGSLEDGTETDIATDTSAQILKTSTIRSKRKKKDVDGKKKRKIGNPWLSCIKKTPD